jgi:hypothetical protein
MKGGAVTSTCAHPAARRVRSQGCPLVSGGSRGSREGHGRFQGGGEGAQASNFARCNSTHAVANYGCIQWMLAITILEVDQRKKELIIRRAIIRARVQKGFCCILPH